MTNTEIPKFVKTTTQLVKVAEKMARDTKKSIVDAGKWEELTSVNRLLLIPGWLTQHYLEKLLLKLKPFGYITMTYRKTWGSDGVYQILRPIPREDIFNLVGEIYNER